VSAKSKKETSEHKFWIDYFELKNGRIKVFRRKDVSKKYYARFTFAGEAGFHQESLRTADKDEAAQLAFDKYQEYQYRQKQGLSIKSKRFGDVAEEYIASLQAKVDRNEIKARKRYNHEMITKRYFEGYFGEMPIRNIGRKEIEAYREYRKNFWISGIGSKERKKTYVRDGKVIKSDIPKAQKGRVPSTSSLNSEESVLRAIFKLAVSRGYVSEKEMPVIRTEGIKWQSRSTFNSSEYGSLIAIGRRRIKEAESRKREREAHQRFMVYNYVLIAANCGARVTELMNLRWKDITWESKDAFGNLNLIFSVSGKSMKRELVANDDCRHYLERIKDRQKAMAEKYKYRFDFKNEYVFCDYKGQKVGSFKKTFNAWMEQAGVLTDSSGKKRCLGSLRIYYCTQRLLKGQNIDIYDLALNMGTSAAMLQKTYSRLTARLKGSKIKRPSFLARETSNKLS